MSAIPAGIERFGVRTSNGRSRADAQTTSEVCEAGQDDTWGMGDRLSDRELHEATDVHPRILKCPLVIDEARVYWQRAAPLVLPLVCAWQREQAEAEADETGRRNAALADSPTQLSTRFAEQAFEEFWFGDKSLRWVSELLGNLHLRFARYPRALEALHRSTTSASAAFDLTTRGLICHWHTQLADPLYRAFTAEFLVARRGHPGVLRHGLRREMVVTWLSGAGKPEWTLATRKKLASKLVSAALSAGLVAKSRDPRELPLPTVPDDAVTYLIYLLREIRIAGSLLDNPYLRSVGLEGRFLDDRLVRLAARGDLAVRRLGNVREVDWHRGDLLTWVESRAGVQAGSSSR